MNRKMFPLRNKWRVYRVPGDNSSDGVDSRRGFVRLAELSYLTTCLSERMLLKRTGGAGTLDTSGTWVALAAFQMERSGHQGREENSPCLVCLLGKHQLSF